MASVDQTIHLTVEMDTTKMEEAIMRLKSALDVRIKCAIADCPREGLERNRIEATLDTAGPPCVRIYMCDEHYDELAYLNKENS